MRPQETEPEADAEAKVETVVDLKAETDAQDDAECEAKERKLEENQHLNRMKMERADRHQSVKRQ